MIQMFLLIYLKRGFPSDAIVLNCTAQVVLFKFKINFHQAFLQIHDMRGKRTLLAHHFAFLEIDQKRSGIYQLLFFDGKQIEA
jgi:hypothetical protein